jgi:GxxExxY protein
VLGATRVRPRSKPASKRSDYLQGKPIGAVYRLDLVVAERIVVEIKAVDRLAPVHEAQLLTYLKHTGITTGLLFNFNNAVLRDGMRRLSL